VCADQSRSILWSSVANARQQYTNEGNIDPRLDGPRVAGEESFMKAITIKQPWVHAILCEGKDVENRSWKRDFRGWLAIHAAATPRRKAVFPRGHRIPPLQELQYSAIVAVAYVSDIRDSMRSKWFYKPPRGQKNYGWVLSKVRPLREPVPCKGALGLWNVPPRLLTKIQKQLPALRLE
jgi:hypothetical protein